ncbi:MAG: YgjP-like metallopeptidase domain-containing protein [Sphingobium sp.]|nr:YgjP-like metallopeptidase domain-containing protein [Sphingobium sp.]
MTRRGAKCGLPVPPRASLKKAIVWARGHEEWVRGQMESAPEQIALIPGAIFLLEGRDVQIRWSASAPRTPDLRGDELHVGGPAEGVEARVLRWLKARALRQLTQDTMMLAEREDLRVAKVGIGDPRGRWGSCTAQGVIRYSWRLILAPPDVRMSTVAHELAHIDHMDHSPAFHARHRAILGRDPGPARAWLKAHGARLQAIGR